MKEKNKQTNNKRRTQHAVVCECAELSQIFRVNNAPSVPWWIMAANSAPARGNGVEPEEAMKIAVKWNKPVSRAYVLKAVQKRPTNLRLNNT